MHVVGRRAPLAPTVRCPEEDALSTADPIVRLVTTVDVDADDGSRGVSLSARHEAELSGGRRVLLLDDRGWSLSGPPDLWSHLTAEAVAATARTVVGPDEPFGGRSSADMAADHWADMARRARRSGLVADASGLRRLPHDVVLSDRVLARAGRGRPDLDRR